MEKILLLTDVPPCKEYSGALLTYNILEQLPKETVVCYTVLNPGLSFLKDSKTLYPITIEYCNKPKEHGLHVSNKYIQYVLNVYNYIRELNVEKIQILQIEDKILTFARSHQVNKIWCILQGQTTIRLALRIAKKLEATLHIQVWDHPEWWMKAYHVDSKTSKKVLKLFEKTIEECNYFGTASFAMSEIYQEKQPNNVPLIASLNITEKVSIRKNEENIIRIGMAGQLYANTEWTAFISALESINWRINGKTVFIRYLGYNMISSGHKMVNIEYLGYRPQEESFQLMSECDILYCPYFFDEKFEIIARTSFPSKLTTYLATGRPIFFHGPDYSSPARFLKENDAAVLCCSLNPEVIKSQLLELLTDKKLSSRVVTNGFNAYLEHLTTLQLKQNAYRFLSLDERCIDND